MRYVNWGRRGPMPNGFIEKKNERKLLCVCLINLFFYLNSHLNAPSQWKLKRDTRKKFMLTPPCSLLVFFLRGREGYEVHVGGERKMVRHDFPAAYVWFVIFFWVGREIPCFFHSRLVQFTTAVSIWSQEKFFAIKAASPTAKTSEAFLLISQPKATIQHAAGKHFIFLNIENSSDRIAINPISFDDYQFENHFRCTDFRHCSFRRLGGHRLIRTPRRKHPSADSQFPIRSEGGRQLLLLVTEPFFLNKFHNFTAK